MATSKCKSNSNAAMDFCWSYKSVLPLRRVYVPVLIEDTSE
jgi:hypothetical protein